ncbi:MAG: PrsW family glutamic-type intramembrane protease [Patescibacteria group bacterium]
MAADQITAYLYALAGGFLPTLIWLWFWLKEDRRRPEPRGLIIEVFLGGALAVMVALWLERFVSEIRFIDSIQNQKVIWFLWAVIEEVLKLAAAYFIAFRNKHFDEPTDAMIYMVTAALGFAALENTLYLSGRDGVDFFLTGNLRFLGATLLHVVSSAMIGGTVGLAFCRSFREKFAYFWLGLITSVLLHAMFNLFIINLRKDPFTGAINVGELVQVFALLWLFTVFVILIFEQVKATFCPPPFATKKLNV